MTSSWSSAQLGDICEFRAGSVFKKEFQGESSGKYPFVKVSDMNLDGNEIYLRSANNWISEEDRQYLKAKIHPEGATVFAKIGVALTYNRRRLLVQPTIIDNNMLSAIPIEGKIRYIYLYLLLLTLDFNTIVVGSALPYLNISDLKKIEVRLPDLETQEKIEKVLFSIEDKIDLNRQINQTLEQIAQAIFKSWFVDFDPVKAKIQARQNNQDPERAACLAISGKTDLSAGQAGEQLNALSEEQRQQLTAIAALFPDALEDSELGEIPRGWGVSNIGNEFDVTMGQSPPGNTYNEIGEGIPFFQGRRDFGWRYPANRVYCTAPKRLANKGDTLLSVRAPVGDINRATSDCCIGRGISALRHKSGCEAYTYYSINRIEKYLHNFDSEGTVFGSINQKGLKAMRTIKPSVEILEEFTKIAGRIDIGIRVLYEEIATLTSIRESLLPKLLSGEIILDNNQFTSEAVA